LAWKHSLGEAEVDLCGLPGGKKFTLVVTTLQAAALGRISDLACSGSSGGSSGSSSGGAVAAGSVQAMRADRLAEAMNVDIDVVKRVLHSLSCGKYKVLKKAGPGGDKKVAPDDEVVPNACFKNPSRRFTVPMASLDCSGAIKAKVETQRLAMHTSKQPQQLQQHVIILGTSSEHTVFVGSVCNLWSFPVSVT